MDKKTYRSISLVIYIAAMVILALMAIPFMQSFKEPEEFKAFINGFGAWGFFVFLFVQIAQILVALIPGELIEFIAGTLYGWLGGLLFCLAGIAIGEALTFCAVRFFGKKFVEAAAGSKAMNKFKFLKDEKKLKIVIFLLFFIPGTPKDLFTYVIPLTSISLRDFLVISILARVPSVFSSTYAGFAYLQNDYRTLLITYAIIIPVSVIGIIIYRFIESRHHN